MTTGHHPPAHTAEAPLLHPRVARVLVAMVVLALALPGIATMLGVGPGTIREGEVRPTAPAWPGTVSALEAFPAAFRAYFDEGFAYRAVLVRTQAAARYLVLKTAPLPTVRRGRDGWLFYTEDGGEQELTNRPPFTTEELAAWRTTLQRTSDWLSGRGITYVFVVAPDKHVVYPEFLPDGLRPVAGPSRIDVLIDDLRAHTTVPVVDLRPALWAAKATERVYHRTDTHWNDRGAAVGASEILRALGMNVRLDAQSRSGLAGLEPAERHGPGLDLAKMLGLASWIDEVDLVLLPSRPRRARILEPARPNARYEDGRIVTTVDDASLPRAVVFRDSFGSALVPFLAEHFSRAVFLWQLTLDPAVVRDERPTVVIHEWAGRKLHVQSAEYASVDPWTIRQ